jgi:hypothetical protein
MIRADPTSANGCPVTVATLLLVTPRRILFNHFSNVRLFTGIAFAGHTGATVAADFFIPSLLRVIFADPPDAVTDCAVGICHQSFLIGGVVRSAFGSSPVTLYLVLLTRVVVHQSL